MSCDFTLAHYEDSLRRALAAGCQVVGFADAPATGPRIYLRHDVDFSLAQAHRMAALEAGLGIRSSYFVQCNTPFYNLFEDETRSIIQQIHGAGHTIGLHLDERGRDRGEDIAAFAERIHAIVSRLIPLARVVSFHRPTGLVVRRTIAGFVSTYEPRFMGQGRYISDSRKQWRAGCLCTRLPDASNSLQVLVHPEWWNDRDLAARSIGDNLLAAKLDQLQRYMNANCQPFCSTPIEQRIALNI